MEKKKSLLEILLMPLIVAFIGIGGTYMVTNQQIKNADKRSKSELQIKLLDIFSEKITSKNIEDREIAVRILSTLDEDLSQKLAKAIVESTTNDSLIKKLAGQIIKGNSYVVISSNKVLKNATNLVDSLSQLSLPYTIQVFKSPNNYYAVCIGGKVSLETANSISKYIVNNTKLPQHVVRTSDFWIGPFYTR